MDETRKTDFSKWEGADDIDWSDVERELRQYYWEMLAKQAKAEQPTERV